MHVSFPLIGIGAISDPSLYTLPWVLYLWNFRLSELNNFLSCQQGEYVSCLLSLLRQMSDTHFQHLLDNFQSKDELKVQQNILCVGSFSLNEREEGNLSSIVCSANCSHSLALYFYRPSFLSYDNTCRCYVIKAFNTWHWTILINKSK